ncbi:MAG: MATE family efflux transporter [Eubacterium sp.]|nr:MATE family efflux transporter [Candidatus Colimonas fimequi]
MDRIKLSDHFTYKRILRFTAPSMAMMIFISVYGMVDGFFVSNFAGKTPFAALNLIMPFIMVLAAAGFMIGTGGSAIVGKTMGEGKSDLAKEYFSFLTIVGLVLGVIFAVVGAIFMRPVALLLGADANMLGDCVVYGRISMISMPAFMLQYMFQSFFITAEKPKLGFYMTVLAGVTNMVLDVVFVGIMDGGIVGAAWATVAGEFVGAIVSFVYFIRENDSTLKLVRTKFYGRVLLKTCTNGCSELASNIAMSFIAIVFNLQLIKYAGEDGVAAYGVIMYVSFVFVALFLGYVQGTAPIISYNFGAQTHNELKNVFAKSMKLMCGGGILITVLSLLTARLVCNIFVGYDPQLSELTIRAYIIYSFTYLFAGVGIFGSGLFTALNNGIISAIISIVRTFVFRLGAVIILPVFLGVDGIWISTCAAEVLAFALSVIFILAFRKKYKYA